MDVFVKQEVDWWTEGEEKNQSTHGGNIVIKLEVDEMPVTHKTEDDGAETNHSISKGNIRIKQEIEEITVPPSAEDDGETSDNSSNDGYIIIKQEDEEITVPPTAEDDGETSDNSSNEGYISIKQEVEEITVPPTDKDDGETIGQLSNKGWRYRGCYQQRCLKLDFDVTTPNFPTTPRSCIQECIENWYPLAMVYNRTKCSCACEMSCFSRYSDDDTYCGIPCPADIGLICGGFTAASLYSSGNSWKKILAESKSCIARQEELPVDTEDDYQTEPTHRPIDDENDVLTIPLSITLGVCLFIVAFGAATFQLGRMCPRTHDPVKPQCTRRKSETDVDMNFQTGGNQSGDQTVRLEHIYQTLEPDPLLEQGDTDGAGAANFIRSGPSIREGDRSLPTTSTLDPGATRLRNDRLHAYSSRVYSSSPKEERVDRLSLFEQGHTGSAAAPNLGDRSLPTPARCANRLRNDRLREYSSHTNLLSEDGRSRDSMTYNPGTIDPWAYSTSREMSTGSRVDIRPET